MLLLVVVVAGLILLLPAQAGTGVFVGVTLLSMALFIIHQAARRGWLPQFRVQPNLAAASPLLMMSVAAFFFRPGSEATAPVALICTLIGAGLMGGSLRHHRLTAPAIASPVVIRERYRPLHYARIAAGIGLLASLTAINTGILPPIATGLQTLMLMAGCTLLITAAFAPQPPALVAKPRLSAVLPVALVILLAFALRVVNLEYAIHRHIDELLSVDSLVQLWDSPDTLLLPPYTGVAAFSRVYTTLQGASVEILGPSLMALRIISAVFGTFTVGAVYFLARELFDHTSGLLAALILATFPPHIHFSRIGINNIVEPFFGVMALAFLVRGMKSRRPSEFALAGVMLGGTQYFYEGGRLLFPVLVVCFALLSRRMTARGWVMLLLSAGLVAAPLYLTLWAGAYSFAPRFTITMADERSGIVPIADIASVIEPMWFFVQWIDTSWFYAGHTALILVFVLPFFLSGGGYALWQVILHRQRAAGALLVLLWLGAAVMGNSLLRHHTHSPRYVVAHAAIALTVAIGIRYVAAIVPQRRRSMLVIIGLSLALLQAGYYFRVHIPTYTQQFPTQILIDDVRFRAAQLADTTHVRLVTDEVLFGSDAYLYLRFTGRHEDGVFVENIPIMDILSEDLEDLVPGRHHAFFIDPQAQIALRYLEDSSLLGPLQSPYGEGRYLLFYSPGTVPDEGRYIGR